MVLYLIDIEKKINEDIDYYCIQVTVFSTIIDTEKSSNGMILNSCVVISIC